MNTGIDKERYKILKGKAERELKNYPYYELIINTNKDNEKDYIVKAIKFVYDRLDDISKVIIDLIYFRDDHTPRDVMDKLMIDKNKFYSKKKNAVDKFIIVLGELC